MTVLHGSVCSLRRPTLRHQRGRLAGARAQATSTTLTLKVGTCSLPHPEKLDTGGEDAFFVSSDKSALGVADGVGGWRETGVDPGDYSRSLMRVACDFFEDHISRPSSSDTKELEELAREAISVAHQKARMPGSSTICILTISPQQKFVSAANLGDSGFAVIRNGTVVFQTPPLQHFFDCPLQLGCCPDFVDATDYPSDAVTYSLNVTPGDVIVMGSDGLWDNCRMDEIVQLLPDKDDEVYKSAEMLAAVAREHAEDEDFESPYIQSAREEGMDLPWWQKILGAKLVDGKLQLGRISGGKLDDITVLVARVSDQLDEPSQEVEAPQASSGEDPHRSQEERLKAEIDTSKDTAPAAA